MTMLIATHGWNFARRGRPTCFLQDGRIVGQGTRDRIFTAPERTETQRFLSRLLATDRR